MIDLLLTAYFYVTSYSYINSTPLLNPHELTPFFSPSLLRKEGEGSNIQRFTPPLCVAERGMGGEFVGKVILLEAILVYT